MEQSTNDAALKVAQAKLSKQECARGTGHTATHMKNPLLLHHALDLNSKRLLLLTPLINVLQQVLRATVVYLEW
jgi:predicted helicase